jgi:hypothetical protein
MPYVSNKSITLICPRHEEHEIYSEATTTTLAKRMAGLRNTLTENRSLI